MATASTAHEALGLYRAALESDALVQSSWHTERGGRQLACGLGVLGPDVDGPSKCPAQIMPRWLAQMVPGFFDRQKFGDAKDWGLRFYAALDRINGVVPFSVVHDWHANTVCQLGIDAAELRKRDTAPHLVLKALHLRALSGEKIAADEWRPVLKNADAYAYAYADAYANAYAYAWKRLRLRLRQRLRLRLRLEAPSRWHGRCAQSREGRVKAIHDHTFTATQPTWSERITLARANPDLAPEYIRSIHDEALALIRPGHCGNRENRAIADACEAWFDCFTFVCSDDAPEFLDELDALLVDEAPGWVGPEYAPSRAEYWA
jgi:hypothetical protein